MLSIGGLTVRATKDFAKNYLSDALITRVGVIWFPSLSKSWISPRHNRRKLRASPRCASSKQDLIDHRDHEPRPYIRERCAALLKVADGQAAHSVAHHSLLKPRDQRYLGRCSKCPRGLPRATHPAFRKCRGAMVVRFNRLFPRTLRHNCGIFAVMPHRLRYRTPGREYWSAPGECRSVVYSPGGV